MKQALAEEKPTQDFHIKKPEFLLQSNTRKIILTELRRKFCMPAALLSSAFGYMKAFCRVELRTLIIKSRDQKR